MSAWQPIETAPKDGSFFLFSTLYEERRATTIAHWSETDSRDSEYPIAAYALQPQRRQWTTLCKPGAADYWQPLPDPPET